MVNMGVNNKNILDKKFLFVYIWFVPERLRRRGI